MILERSTSGLCNVCYKTIPATVRVDRNGAFIEKRCSQHGEQRAMVERDPAFYAWVQGMRCPSIYEGYFVDVTRRCNLRCKWCYYALQKQDPAGVYSIENIVDECASQARLAPFILTGGEPTVRPDIVDLVKAVKQVGHTEMITNGVNLSEPKLYQDLMPHLCRRDQGLTVADLHLSIHDMETDKWGQFADMCRADGVKIESALVVIDSRERFVKAIEMARSIADTTLSFRIKAASVIWNEQKPGKSDGDGKVFVSDMLGWLEEMGGKWVVVPRRNQKSVFVHVMWEGLSLMLVSWNDTQNVDLNDIDCAPYYRARSGAVHNIVTSMLINEGMEKGWLHGRKMA